MAEAAVKLSVDDEPVLRRATGLDRPKMLELVRIALGEGSIPRTEAFWRWKHEQSPFGRSPIMVMEAEGRIVSLRVFLRWRWRFGGQTLKAVRPVDTATHPDWRRRGLFERLTRELIDMMRREGVAFVYNTPNPHSGRGYQKLGWHIVGRPSIWIRPLKPGRLIQGLWHRRDRNADRERFKTDKPLCMAAIDQPELDDFLIRQASIPSRLMTDIDASYLTWRYRDCPGLDYGADGLFDRQAGALLIYRFATQFGMKEFRICDLFVTEDKASKDKAKSVIRSKLRACDADFASARAIPGTPQAAVLRRCGFLPAPRIGPVVAVRPLSDSSHLSAIQRLPNWGAVIGDLEVF